MFFCKGCNRTFTKRGFSNHLNSKPLCRSVNRGGTEVSFQAVDLNNRKMPTVNDGNLTKHSTSQASNPTNPTLIAIPPKQRPPVATDPPSDDRPDRLQDTADCVYVYPPDEETDLRNYLSTLPDDDDVFQPMELTEIGVPTARPASNEYESDPTLTPEQRQLFHSVRNPYILEPTVDDNPNKPPEEEAEISRTPPARSYDLTSDVMANTELLKLLVDVGAPLRLYHDVISWAKNHSARGYDFCTEQSTYGSMISHLQRTFNMSEYRPILREVSLPPLPNSKKEKVLVEITTFDFSILLHSLLSDPELNTPENLTVDPDHPFSEYPKTRLNKFTKQSEPIPLGEVHTGEWYHRTWASMVRRSLDPKTKFNKNFMIGIILYTDSTVLNIIGGLSCHPVNFTLSIFTEKCRRQSKAWRTLGFIPQKEAYEIRNSNAGKMAGVGLVNNRRYHIIMAAILKSFFLAQRDGALNGLTIHLGGYTKTKVNLYVPLAFIIADVPEADMICSFYSSTNITDEENTRICRTCDATVSNACNTLDTCNRYRMWEMMRLVQNKESDKLKAMNQRLVWNCFYSIDMGDDVHGIYGKCHTEAMHAIQEGIIKYILDIFMNKALKPKDCGEFDECVSSMCAQIGDHGKDEFPRTSWQYGYTKLTNITASDRVGKMFTCVLFLVTSFGSKIFDRLKIDANRIVHITNKKKREKAERNNKVRRVDPNADLRTNFVEVFEMILCLWAWLKQDEFWKRGDKQYENYAQDAIKTLIDKLNELMPRVDGQGWNITKVHELLHIIFDIFEYGAHNNVNSDKCESSHKELIKKPAKQAQRRVATLDQSIANRQVDRLIIEKAYGYVKSVRDGNKNEFQMPKQQVSLGTKGVLVLKRTFRQERSQYTYSSYHQWENNRDNIKQLTIYHQTKCFAGLLQKAMLNRGISFGTNDVIKCRTFTEFTNDRGVLLRCHPDYRGAGPWYDWVVFNRPGEKRKFLGRLISLVGHPLHRDMSGVKHLAQWAIVKPMIPGSMSYHSVLTRSFSLQRDYYQVILVNSILNTTLCVPNYYGPGSALTMEGAFLWVLPRVNWGSQFVETDTEFHKSEFH